MYFSTVIEKNDTKEIVKSGYISWDFFRNSKILITGATGLIGFQTVLALLYANESFNLNMQIFCLVRNQEKAERMFNNYPNNNLTFIYQTIQEPINFSEKIDYVIHTANTTSSREMTEKPADTLDSIFTGTKNILDFANNNGVKSIVYLSSMEIYGNISIDRAEPLSETDYGYINIMKPRSSYPVGKRAAEALCSAYFHQYNTPVKVARLAQTIGAGVDYNDGRVFAEFARCITEKRDIILKTKGESIRSYIYITDAITAILSMLEKGENGESYNVANPETTCSVHDLAEMLHNKYSSSNIRIELNNQYYPAPAKYFLSADKYNKISGWQASVSLSQAFDRLIKSFRIKYSSKKTESKYL